MGLGGSAIRLLTSAATRDELRVRFHRDSDGKVHMKKSLGFDLKRGARSLSSGAQNDSVVTMRRYDNSG